MADDPLLYLGLDIAIKRDTCALVGVYRDVATREVVIWGHRIWEPPINLVTQVEPMLSYLLGAERIAALLYDPYQCAATAQKLAEDGHGQQLVEVNQQTQMVPAANTLHHLITTGQMVGYNDPDMRSQFSWCNAQHTERGWRIVKQRQSKPIDVVVALAMAAAGAVGELGHTQHPGFDSKLHARGALALP